jgi:hypothetical protein
MGIASGVVTVGFVGTPLRYNCSVFGLPVTLAARCAGIKVKKPNVASIVFPADTCRDYTFKDIFESEPPNDDNDIFTAVDVEWKQLPTQKIKLKNMGNVEVVSFIKTNENPASEEFYSEWDISQAGITPQQEAQEDLKLLYRNGRYKPINERDDIL